MQYNVLMFLLLSLILPACSNTHNTPATATLPRSNTNTETPFKLGTAINLSGSETIQLYATEFNNLPGWELDNHNQAYNAFQHSCASWQLQANDKVLSPLLPLGRLGDWKRLCSINVPKGKEKQFFETWFKPFAVSEHNNFEGLFTGYYLPELHGSFQKSRRYHVPIYGIPHDLVKKGEMVGRMQNGQLLPYYDRAEISAGALLGKNAELLWVDNEIDAFFMEIQGSGKVILEDGRVQALSFAAKNGRQYYAIGRWLVEKGYIPLEQISMQSIREWIIHHPEQAQSLMQKNQSVIFFRLSETLPNDGPVGSMNTPLTAGYSLAVDNSFLPLGLPLWIDLSPISGQQRIQRLVMAQDTGSAIKGLIRGDVFWGQGLQAGEMAGQMKSTGRFFMLVPKSLGLK
ncbi:MltA domain-containing protein [Methylomonas sp. AM2-LC]|uniref:murein transglycosylase A n=1 Tax=Methylomonas sp. AM2-LC TaxID=3153301 RepID=UPI003264D981